MTEEFKKKKKRKKRWDMIVCDSRIEKHYSIHESLFKK